MSHRIQLRRLQLRVERALAAQRHLRALVIEADAALAAVRRELRNLKARIARAAAAIPVPHSKERHS